jgi:hypothetical protein
MGKFEFATVAVVMMVLAVGTHAADNLDAAWDKYLVTLFFKFASCRIDLHALFYIYVIIQFKNYYYHF